MKEKRKGRLDKDGGKTEFIGFGAFASEPANVAAAANDGASTPTSVSQWSPVYTGRDESVASLFARIGQKRDTNTKVKALTELQAFFADESIPKRAQVQALQHWAWLYANKLGYDSAAAVRALCVQVWIAVARRLIKATTNLLQQYADLVGMLYATQTDPDTTVRNVATSMNSQALWNLAIDWSMGVSHYTQRILSYGRASVLHQELFSTKKQLDMSNMTEAQRDAMEERFERLVGNALESLTQWIQTGESPIPAETVWFKTLHSPKTSLRRKTYALLAAVGTHQPKDLPDNLGSVVSQVLSSEKEAVNIPTLLETVVTLISRVDTLQTNSDVTKALGKLLKKAGYGAQVRQWGPMLLPLVAHVFEPLPLLQAAWQGREKTLAVADQWALLLALAECCVFLLLRRADHEPTSGDTDMTTDADAETPRALAQLWLQTLQEALATSQVTGAAQEAYDQLIQELAKNLLQLANEDRAHDCAFCSIYAWFWTEGLALSEAKAVALARLLREMCKQQQQQESATTASSPWIPQLQQRFEKTLANYQGSSGAVPSPEAYQLLSAILDFGGASKILHQEGSLERFVMNDLLRWTVIHTSTLSTQAQSLKLVEQNFELVATCLTALDEMKRFSVWESFLREVVAAQCDLKWLVAGLQMLLTTAPSSIDWLPCPTLNELAIDVGRQSTSSPSGVEFQGGGEREEAASQSSVDADEEYHKSLEFLQLCLGLLRGSSFVLVSTNVLRSWVDDIRPLESNEDTSLALDEAPSSVLEALLQFVYGGTSTIETTDVDDLLLETWRQGGRLYEEYGKKLACQDSSTCARCITQWCTQLRNDLSDLCSRPDERMVAECAIRWADRAGRVLDICGRRSDLGDDVPAPSFGLIGLADVGMWQSHPKVLFCCAMPLLQRTCESGEQVSLVEGNIRQDGSCLTMEILLALSEAHVDSLAASRTRTRRDCCAQFLSVLGGKTLDGTLVEEWARFVLAGISGTLKKEQNDATERALRNQVAVFSQLLELMFVPILPPGTSDFAATEIQEGATVWYITEPKDPAIRVSAEVVKVHYDAQAGYYFSLRLDHNGEVQERQTVLERLRKEPQYDPSIEGVSVEEISIEEQSKRGELRALIVEDLIKPFLLTTSWRSSFPELVNVVVRHVGLGGERGLGTPYYDVFQLVSSVVEALCHSLSQSNWSTAVDALWTMSTAFGYGLNTPSTRWIFDVLTLDPVPSYQSILDAYANVQVGVDPSLDLAVLAWLACSIKKATLGDREEDAKSVIMRTVVLLFDLAAKSLDNEDIFTEEALIATKAVYEGLILSSSFQGDESSTESCQKSEADTLSLLVKSFANDWDNESKASFDSLVASDHGIALSEGEPDWLLFSCFPQIMKLARRLPGVLRLLANASVSANANHLSNALFIAPKRQFALQLLDAVASRGEPLHSDDDESIPNEGTTVRMKVWSEGMVQEEAEELQEDVEIVSQWLPSQMMNEIESWHEDTFQDLDDGASIGRLLTWITVLRFIDVAAPTDFRNRPAFVSYLGKCGAVDYILNLALLFDETINDPKNTTAPAFLEMNDAFQDGSLLTLSKLASLVLFRTIEVLPSLSRHWFENECPRTYSTAVQSFVEKYVAPEILKHELERIKTATSSFGEMNVSASLVSREVVATYEQDDFNLTVLVRLPACFPLRSAEVDCSKTLGVPPSRWKRWSLQITLMLNNQGGTLQDALMLWKDNVDKEFEGVEPCPVCYSVLHVKTHKLPALECKTCQNRFHVDCLTQWFKSSGKTQCVLCQQPWQGSRIQ